MAWYKNKNYLSENTHANFDKLYSPGGTPPSDDSGIFRCEGCGKEIAHTQGTKLPPQNHHQHTKEQGEVRWRMIVCAQS